jgi:NADP-dependent 3-hydroxy acid dehydrogenase YdfG
MGFAGQLRAIQDAHRAQIDRIATLEKQNAELKSSQADMQDLFTRITAMEEYNENLAARRREVVGQLLNLRSLHQEAGNAFILRSQDIQPDDFEGMVQVYASSVMTVMNHHQRVLGQLSVNGQIQNYASQSSYAACASNGTYTHHQQANAVYPTAYNQAGYCRAHGVPYCCRICGQ